VARLKYAAPVSGRRAITTATGRQDRRRDWSVQLIMSFVSVVSVSISALPVHGDFVIETKQKQFVSQIPELVG